MTYIREDLEARASEHIQAPEHLVREKLRGTPRSKLFTVLGPLDLIERGFVFKNGLVVGWPDWYSPDHAERRPEPLRSRPGGSAPSNESNNNRKDS